MKAAQFPGRRRKPMPINPVAAPAPPVPEPPKRPVLKLKKGKR